MDEQPVYRKKTFYERHRAKINYFLVGVLGGIFLSQPKIKSLKSDLNEAEGQEITGGGILMSKGEVKGLYVTHKNAEPTVIEQSFERPQL